MKNYFVILPAIALLAYGCATTSASNSSGEASPEVIASDCVGSLPKKVPIRKDELSKDVEAEADKLEKQGKGKEALDKYSEAYILYSREFGYATGRAMRGDVSASMELNTSVDSPEFPYKIGRAFAKTGKHEVAIICFTESLNGKIKPPNDASAYLNRGDAYEKMGATDKAKADFQQAVNLFKKYKLSGYQKLSEKRLQALTKK